MKKLDSFKEKELIKVITGLRRSGKSILMEQFIDYLKENGVKNNQIIKLNFEEKENEIEYYQVATSLYDDNTKVREINSLKAIKDNYKKTILTLDDYGAGNVDGINIVNLREWLCV